MEEMIRLGELLGNIAPPRGATFESFYDCMRQAFIADEKSYLALFTHGDITNIDGYEAALFVEPRSHLCEADYLWEFIKDEWPDIKYKDYTYTQDLYALLNEGEKQCVFLLGDPGCGKSTFLRHFKTTFEQKKPGAVCVMLNFQKWRDKVNTEEQYRQLEDGTTKEIEAALNVEIQKRRLHTGFLQHVLEHSGHPKLRRFRLKLDTMPDFDWSNFADEFSQWQEENPEGSALLALQFLRAQEIHVLILLDDIDPIPIFYQQPFARRALILAHTSDIQIVVALRYFSLDLAVDMATNFTGYLPCVLAKLDLPPIPELLRKRVRHFVQNKLVQRGYRLQIMNGVTVTVSRDSLNNFLDFVNDAIFTEELVGTLICMSDMSIPRLIQNYEAILKTRHLELTPDLLREFFEAHRRPRAGFWPNTYDVLLKALITNGGWCYSPGRASVSNLFCLRTKTPTDYYPALVKRYLLEMIYNLSVDGVQGERHRCFVSKKTLIEKAMRLGWDADVASEGLRELYAESLVFGLESNLYEFVDRVAISNVGIYYRSKLWRMVYYIFFMCLEHEFAIDNLGPYVRTSDSPNGRKVTFKRDGDCQDIWCDDCIHGLVGCFIRDFMRLEKGLIVEGFKHVGGPETFAECIRRPLSEALLLSFVAHVEKGGKGEKLKTVCEDLNLELRNLLREIQVQTEARKH